MRTCRPTAGSAPSRFVASHGDVSLGRAMGLWVIAVGVRPTSHNCYPQVTKAVSHVLCVDQHRTTVCTSHTSAFPEKRSATRTFVAHVSTCGWLTRSDRTRRTDTGSWPSQETLRFLQHVCDAGQVVPRKKLEQTLNAAARPHSGP